MEVTISWERFWSAVEKWLADTGTWALYAMPAIVGLLLLAIVGNKLLKWLVQRIKRKVIPTIAGDGSEPERRAQTLFGIIASSLRVALWVIVVILILEKLGLDIAPLIAGVGIAGLALGFGAQELVRDFIAGFFMLLENQVRNGDVVTVNGVSGSVETVGLRTIVIRDSSGTVHVFQNGKINTIANQTKDWSAAIFDIAVSNRENPTRVADILRESAAALKSDPAFGAKIIDDIEIFGMEAYGETSIVIKSRIKTQPMAQWEVARAFRSLVKEAFERAAVELPPSTRIVEFRDGGTKKSQ